MSTKVTNPRYRRRKPLWRKVKEGAKRLEGAIELIGNLNAITRELLAYNQACNQTMQKMVDMITQNHDDIKYLTIRINFNQMDPLIQQGKETRILCEFCAFPTHFGACPLLPPAAHGIPSFSHSRQVSNEPGEEVNLKENDRERRSSL
jgi:hypothetical protein